jgi:hypothetical protein
MKQFYLLLLFLGQLFLTCCNTPNHENKNQLLTFDLKDLPKVSSVKLSDLGIEDIQYIPLETKDSCVIPEDDIFLPIKIVASDKFYLLDVYKKILKFRDDGTFETKIGTRGRGPDEYTVAHDINTDDKNQNIYLLSRWQKKFFVYSETGAILKTFPVLFSPNEFRVLENGILCYGSNNQGNINDSYDFIDFNGKIIKTFQNKFPFTIKDGYVIWRENIFYQYNSRLFKKEVYSDTIFEFENMNFKPHMVIAVGKYLITPKARSEFDGLSLYKKYITPMNLLEFGDYVFYEFMYPEDELFCFIGSKRTTFQVLIDGGNGIINDLDGGPDILPKTMKDDNTIIALVDAMKLKQHISSDAFINSKPKYPEKKKELEKLAASLKETDNPVLMLVRLKKK